jgi:hypothetical protein
LFTEETDAWTTPDAWTTAGPDDPTTPPVIAPEYEEWLERGEKLVASSGEINWAIGDWLYGVSTITTRKTF